MMQAVLIAMLDRRDATAFDSNVQVQEYHYYPLYRDITQV